MVLRIILGRGGLRGPIKIVADTVVLLPEKELFYFTKTMSERMSGDNNPMHGKSGELSPNFGKTFSEEHRRKISESLSGENHPNYGKPLKNSTKQKLSERMSGENHPQYGKRGELSPNYGRKHTEESKAKISESRVGEKHHNYKPRDWFHPKHGKITGISGSDLVKNVS
jgi:hypothetical protein